MEPKTPRKLSKDSLSYKAAVMFVEEQYANIQWLQRDFNLSRLVASGIMDELEAAGVVSEWRNGREVLIKSVDQIPVI